MVAPTALKCVPLSLAFTLPGDIDPIDVARDVANTMRTLQRPCGERYAARADIVLPHLRPDAFELIVSGVQLETNQQILILLGLIWARRPWDDRADERRQVVLDARNATATWCAERWPGTPAPKGMPIGMDTVRWSAVAGQVVRTRDSDTDLVPATHLI